MVFGALYRSRVSIWSSWKSMAAWRRVNELWLDVDDRARLETIAQSRTEPAVGANGRGYCWPIWKTLRFLRWRVRCDCIIRRCSAVSSAPWPKAR